MKQNRTLAALLLTAALLATTATGCTMNAAGTTSPESEAATDVAKVGILQVIEHNALDAAYEGFVAALEDNGYQDGENLELDYQNAQGDQSNLSTISDRFVSQKKDLVLAIATDSVQSIASKTTEIPILATAVTSYTTAGLVEDENAPGGNISGTSDMNPVAAQIELITELVPDVQTIGLAYNSSEANSVLQIDLAKKTIDGLGLQWTEVTVTNVNDVQQAVQSLAESCEALYIPTDNTLASAMATVHSIAGPAGLPTFCGESNMVLEGGLATMGINYYDLGYKTGLMAVEVLQGKDIATMPIQYADSSDAVTINGLVAREIGYTVPEAYLDAVIEPEE